MSHDFTTTGTHSSTPVRRRSSLLLAGLVIATLSAALQAQQCEQLNAATPLVTGAVTPAPFPPQTSNQTGWCFTATQTMTVRSGALFTNSVAQNDFMRVEVWTDVYGFPGVELAAATYRSPQSTTQDPWGFVFDRPFPITAGGLYWIIWIESGNSQIPEEPGGVLLPKITRPSSAAPWLPTAPAALKFILCDTLLDSRGVTAVGSPCLSSAGRLGAIFTNESPSSGNRQFNVEASGFPAGATAVLFFGLTPGFTPQPLAPLGFPAGCELYGAPALTLLAPIGTAAIGAPPATPRPNPAGHFVFRLPIPSGAAGTFFSTQVFALDAGSPAPIPMIASNGLNITVF